jgi:hypothetical protein
MKRFILPGLIALGLFSFSAAEAQVDFTNLGTGPVPFRRWLASGNVDSTYRHSAVAAGTMRVDTTAAFLRTTRFSNQGLALDSILTLTVAYVPVDASITVTADSAYLTLQGSWNGIDWDGAPTIAVLEAGATNQFSWTFNTSKNADIPATTLTNLTVGSYPMWRAIINSDAAGRYQVLVNQPK